MIKTIKDFFDMLICLFKFAFVPDPLCEYCWEEECEGDCIYGQ